MGMMRRAPPELPQVATRSAVLPPAAGGVVGATATATGSERECQQRGGQSEPQ